MTKTVHDATTAVNSPMLHGFVVDHLARTIVERAIPRHLLRLYSAALVGGFPARSPLVERLGDVLYTRAPDVSARASDIWAINGRRRLISGRGLILGMSGGQPASATVTRSQLLANIWFVHRAGAHADVWLAAHPDCAPERRLSGGLPFPQAFRL